MARTIRRPEIDLDSRYVENFGTPERPAYKQDIINTIESWDETKNGTEQIEAALKNGDIEEVEPGHYMPNKKA